MGENLPLLLNAALGNKVERPPVWMMRQAGRYMKIYRDLREKYPSFRERSENPSLSYEISMQPFREFEPDGVILFSDILTPLPGMGINFEIIESKGPIIENPIRTIQQIKNLKEFIPSESLSFVGEVLNSLKTEISNKATLLGFVGAPWTLAAYVVEGKSSKNYSIIKSMAFREPESLHKLLDYFANSIGEYLKYQIKSGAQVVQIFDSWAGQLSPQDYDIFAGPYQKKVVDIVKDEYPNTPIILYISGSAGLIERMAKTGVDIISLDWTVDIKEASERLPKNIGIQGNIDPGILFGDDESIKNRIDITFSKVKGKKYILNLGHGILPGTPEESARTFFEYGKSLTY
tara:strand:+ start:119 stop:1159 length:1041 start_codon:yes stop_codon:yes gene_type:complete